MADHTPTPLRNSLLANLPLGQLERISPHLQEVPMRVGAVLYEPGESIEIVYFPQQCVISALTVMKSGNAIEVGTIGREGGCGLSVLVGNSISLHRVVAQIGGKTLRMSADVLKREASAEGPARDRFLNHQTCFLAQVSQSVACNGLHPIQKRCCRWLLITHDRLDSDVLPLTHEYLAMMLGVRRAGVTEVLQGLQERGVISYSRGKITITDRRKLESLSCECYDDVRQVYDRLLG